MKKSALIEVHLFLISVLFVLLATGCKKDNDDSTVTDIDGNVYNTVAIGSQVWMKENLKTTKFKDGAAIPNVTSDSEWGSTITPDSVGTIMIRLQIKINTMPYITGTLPILENCALKGGVFLLMPIGRS